MHRLARLLRGFCAPPPARRRRAVVAVLLQAAWLLPFLVPPAPAAEPLPDCCLWSGAHKCSLRHAAKAAGALVLTEPCNRVPPSKDMASTDRTALQLPLVHGWAPCPAPRETLPDRVDQIPAAVFGDRSARAPPRLG